MFVREEFGSLTMLVTKLFFLELGGGSLFWSSNEIFGLGVVLVLLSTFLL